MTIADVVPPIPTSNEVHHHIMKNALLLVDSGDYELAKNLLILILEKDANHPEALKWLGWCSNKLGNLELAETCFNRLTKIRELEDDHFEFGEFYYKQGKYDLALKHWMHALSICNPNSPRLFEIHKNLGNVYTLLSDFEAAEENYNKALVLQPESDTILVNLGSMEMSLGNYAKAFSYYRRACIHNDTNPRAWCGLGVALYEENQPDQALVAFEKCLELDPLNITAIQAVATWAVKQKNYEPAIINLGQYLEKVPNDQMVRGWMKEISERHNGTRAD